ncbi:MAG TPA: M20 family metallopeptidase [Peptostreptococcaceae bacterium]|nr:M20 family metallopeptidase [Peptostreptococcaceae bacterium]
MKNIILDELAKFKKNMIDINDFMYNNPELGNEEHKAVEKLTNFLGEHNFNIEIGVADIPTAFRAIYESKIPGPSIAYLCEYDALPQIGHGCGHNMIGTMSTGAAIALSKTIDKIGGKIVVLGTPAEETDGGKVYMVEKGIFDDVDVAMILHPGSESTKSGESLAMDAIQFEFRGKASHAAASPEEGINALDGVIQTFNGINALRQHIKSDVRIHGIVKEGGVAANIVPDYAVAQFYVRAKEREYLDKVVEKVKNVARGASLMTGATLEISNYEISYDNLKTNKTLSKLFTENLKNAGVKEINEPRSSFGSIDMGNVSLVVPSIHPYIGLDCLNITSHSREMADMTVSDIGHERLIQGATALAFTGYDIISDENLLNKIKEEFENSK